MIPFELLGLQILISIVKSHTISASAYLLYEFAVCWRRGEMAKKCYVNEGATIVGGCRELHRNTAKKTVFRQVEILKNRNRLAQTSLPLAGLLLASCGSDTGENNNSSGDGMSSDAPRWSRPTAVHVGG